MGNVRYIIEFTVGAVILAWVLTHNHEFGQVVSATSNATLGGVQTLWALDKHGSV